MARQALFQIFFLNLLGATFHREASKSQHGSHDAFDGRRVRTALVDGALLGHAVQIDGALEKAPRSGAVPLGAKQEVDRVTITVDGSVQVLLRPCPVPK